MRKYISVHFHYIRFALEDIFLILKKFVGSLDPIDMLAKTILVKKLNLCATLVGLLHEE